jgi:hypothetical protein
MKERQELPPESARAAASTPPPALNRSAEVPSTDPRIEDYLDHVCAPLVGVVPYAKRQELRAELRTHLEARAATYEELGKSAEIATLEALRQFGDPRDLARQWAREWAKAPPTGRVEPAWRAMVVALGCFGVATVLALALIVLERETRGSLASDVRSSMWFAALYLLPLLAGLTTGLLAPARHALGTFHALAVIVSLVAPASGLPVLRAESYPDRSLAACGMELAFIQVFCWVPLGLGAAVLGGSLRARRTPKPRRWVLQ